MDSGQDESSFSDNPPPENENVQGSEMVEDVLEKGMQFLNGVFAMATGKPLQTDNQNKMVTIDRITGEVTVKFKLPGF